MFGFSPYGTKSVVILRRTECAVEWKNRPLEVLRVKACIKMYMVAAKMTIWDLPGEKKCPEWVWTGYRYCAEWSKIYPVCVRNDIHKKSSQILCIFKVLLIDDT
jgi:hypothetical protein